MVSGVTFLVCSFFWNLAEASLSHGWESTRAQLAPQPQEAKNQEPHDFAALHFRGPYQCHSGPGSNPSFEGASLRQPTAGDCPAAACSNVYHMAMPHMCSDEQSLGSVLPGMWRTLGVGYGAWTMESRDTPAPKPRLLPLRGQATWQGACQRGSERGSQRRQVSPPEAQISSKQAQQRQPSCAFASSSPGNQGSHDRAVAQATQGQGSACCQGQRDSGSSLRAVARKGSFDATHGAAGPGNRSTGLCQSADGADRAEHRAHRGESPPQACCSAGGGLTSLWRRSRPRELHSRLGGQPMQKVCWSC